MLEYHKKGNIEKSIFLYKIIQSLPGHVRVFYKLDSLVVSVPLNLEHPEVDTYCSLRPQLI